MTLAPCLVLVTGHAAAGKSTLAPRLAAALGAIWISRDYFEGGVVWELFLWMLETVAPHHPVVADTPFNHQWNREMFDEARPKIPVPLVEVALHGDPEALLLRARRRSKQPGVHEIKARFSVRPDLYRADYQPVLPADQVVWVDTTDPDLVDVEGVATEVRRKLLA